MLDSFAWGIRMPKPYFKFTLPRSWPSKVRSAMLHVVSLAQYAAVFTRSWAADSSNARVRLKAEKDRLQQEVAQLHAEMCIKDARMKSLSPSRRPYYPVWSKYSNEVKSNSIPVISSSALLHFRSNDKWPLLHRQEWPTPFSTE